MLTSLRAAVRVCIARGIAAIAVACVAACASPSGTSRDAIDANVQYTFASPEEAGLALANAAADLDGDSLRNIFGPNIAMLSSGDSTQDDLDLQRFAIAYDRAHSILRLNDDESSLVVGDQGWTLPVPIVRDGDRWHFDTVAGGTIVREARIELNHRDAVPALAELANSQQMYFEMDPDGDGTKAYASRIVSSDSRRDGLFWSDALADPISPVGVEFAAADASDPSATPRRGYLFRILAPTGQRGSNVVSILAFPATYGDSGRATFVIVDGVVWRRDLGESTRSEAMAMRGFTPNASWTRVAPQ